MDCSICRCLSSTSLASSAFLALASVRSCFNLSVAHTCCSNEDLKINTKQELSFFLPGGPLEISLSSLSLSLLGIKDSNYLLQLYAFLLVGGKSSLKYGILLICCHYFLFQKIGEITEVYSSHQVKTQGLQEKL